LMVKYNIDNIYKEEYVEHLKFSIEMQRQLDQKRRVLKEEKELSEIEEFFEEDLEIHQRMDNFNDKKIFEVAV